MKTTWTAEELKAALIQYDSEMGSYPEHEYEGWAFWGWLNGRGNMKFAEMTNEDREWDSAVSQLRDAQDATAGD